MSGTSGTSERKEEHLEICVDPSRFEVETRRGGAGFDRLAFAHRALPELSLSALDTSVEFLGSTLRLPLLVSCMTGGSSGGGRVNRELAAAANEAGIAVGMGSFRVLLRHPEHLRDFCIKSIACDIPLLANIGAVSLREEGIGPVLELAHRVEADALVVHLNPGQELFQLDGDRDFTLLRDAINRLVDAADLPIIVKETGFGIGPAETLRLLADGVAWVDVAGSGGTNWIAVESYRLEEGPLREAAAAFDDWGYPSALLLAAIGMARSGGGPATSGAAPVVVAQAGAILADSRMEPRLIASGGIRNGVDVAKALALGAGLAAMALPLVRAVEAGGRDGALQFIERVATGLRAAMLLTGSSNLAALRRGILRMDPDFSSDAEELVRADAAGNS
jgi:isopentenyl-diphosphate delta-isomerase type 2